MGNAPALKRLAMLKRKNLDFSLEGISKRLRAPLSQPKHQLCHTDTHKARADWECP